jgi:hypothetical protein
MYLQQTKICDASQFLAILARVKLADVILKLPTLYPSFTLQPQELKVESRASRDTIRREEREKKKLLLLCVVRCMASLLFFGVWPYDEL